VQRLQPRQQLQRHVRGALRRHAVNIGARSAVHELADEIDVALEDAGIEHAKQIGMVEPRHQLRFLQQQPCVANAERRRIDELHRDVDVEEPVPAVVDGAERASAEHIPNVHAGNRKEPCHDLLARDGKRPILQEWRSARYALASGNGLSERHHSATSGQP
jgi:hypothetical protein